MGSKSSLDEYILCILPKISKVIEYLQNLLCYFLYRDPEPRGPIPYDVSVLIFSIIFF